MSRSALARNLLGRKFVGCSSSRSTSTVAIPTCRWLSTENGLERVKPSVLSGLSTEDSAGKAWFTIAQEYKGGFPVRHADVQEIFRRSSDRDARLIRHMLTQLKQNHRFILQSDEAHTAMQVMTTDNDNIETLLFAAQSFLDKQKNGLYYSATVDSIEELLLKPLLEAVQASGTHSEDASKLAHQIIHTLLIRGSRPYQRMKKRAARKYLRHLECPVGPYPSTLHLALQVILYQNPHNHTHAQKLLSKYTATNRTILPESTSLIEQAAAQAVAAAEAEAEENVQEDTDANDDDPSSEETQK